MQELQTKQEERWQAYEYRLAKLERELRSGVIEKCSAQIAANSQALQEAHRIFERRMQSRLVDTYERLARIAEESPQAATAAHKVLGCSGMEERIAMQRQSQLADIDKVLEDVFDPSDLEAQAEQGHSSSAAVNDVSASHNHQRFAANGACAVIDQSAKEQRELKFEDESRDPGNDEPGRCVIQTQGQGNDILEQMISRIDALESGRSISPKTRVSQPQSSGEPSEKFDTIFTDARETIYAEGIEYCWQHTIYDVGTFIGPVGIFNSTLITILLITCAFVQVSFTLVVLGHLTVPKYTEALSESVYNWRIMIGHGFAFYQETTGNSLVRDICENSRIVTTGSAQSALVREIRAYLEIKHYVGGETLHVIALFIWLMKIGEELNKICAWGEAMWLEVRRDAISLVRFSALIVCITIPRLFITFFLAVVGVMYIVATADLHELILNCIALAMILDIDELLYAAFIPLGLKTMMSRADPVVFPIGSNILRKLLSVLLLGLICVAVFITRQTMLLPVIEHMQDVESILCSGSLDWIWLQAASVVKVAQTNLAKGGLSPYALLAVDQRAWPDDVSALTWRSRYARYASEKHSQLLRDLSVDEGNYSKQKSIDWMWNSGVPRHQVAVWHSRPCLDIHPRQTEAYAWFSMLQFDLGIGATNCEEVPHELCINHAIPWSGLARYYCPQKCGCNDASRYFFLSGAFAGKSGCPADCRTPWRKSLALLGKCQDKDYSSPAFWTYLDSLFKVMTKGPRREQTTTKQEVEAMREPFRGRAQQYGCGVFNESSHWPDWNDATDFCNPIDKNLQSVGASSAQGICPETCGHPPTLPDELDQRPLSCRT